MIDKDINTNKHLSYKEFVASKETTNWLMMMNEETESLDKNET